MANVMTHALSRRNLLATSGALAVTLGASWRTRAHGDEDHGDATPGAMGTPEGTPEMDMGGSGVAAVFMTITNHGDEPDRLVGGQTDVANVVEIHTMKMKDGVMQMEQLPNGLEIPAGETVILKPGAEHVMLIGLTQDIEPESEFTVTLEFEKAGEVDVISRVRMTPELPEGAEVTEPVTAGDLEITDVWSRPAPMITAGEGTPTAMATPAS